MKRFFVLFICFVLIFSLFAVEATAIENDGVSPYVIDFNIKTYVDENLNASDGSRASLIHSYSLYLTKTGNTLNITGQTYGSGDVVKSGFKDLTIQRRKTSDDSWKDYYEYGNEKGSSGYLLYQDLGWKFSKINFILRLAFFDAQTYENRLYSYENDVLYAFSSNQYNGKGIRFFFNFNYKIFKNLH